MVKGNIFVPFGTPPIDENRQTELKQGSQALAAADFSEVMYQKPAWRQCRKPRRRKNPVGAVTNCVDIGDGDGTTSPCDSNGAAGTFNLVTVNSIGIGAYNKTSCALVRNTEGLEAFLVPWAFLLTSNCSIRGFFSTVRQDAFF
jgi:hypothetical protein